MQEVLPIVSHDDPSRTELRAYRLHAVYGVLLRVGPVPDRGKELAGFPFIPRPWETCRSFVSYGGQVATEAALLLQCEVLLQHWP